MIGSNSVTLNIDIELTPEEANKVYKEILRKHKSNVHLFYVKRVKDYFYENEMFFNDADVECVAFIVEDLMKTVDDESDEGFRQVIDEAIKEYKGK